MIVTENKTIRNHEYLHTYSDKGYYIQSVDDGEYYEDAYDPYNSTRTYTETDTLIPREEND